MVYLLSQWVKQKAREQNAAPGSGLWVKHQREKKSERVKRDQKYRTEQMCVCV